DYYCQVYDSSGYYIF
nr:immunoglobulin light chain junction region [Macaca mulatta]MOY06479.1 immunoglobulin light chain junction region [Macaca mulatta]MOY06778.1 immunoglobulin light chain junction region [Macaca mulatta]MOY07589.1 immunoglobulin light chain junction region [Macaca mulatta]MOY07692.1 immunoglobulin light chain junction region [Macaca mulatta]